MNFLDDSFYLNPNVVEVARNLLGKKLCTVFNGKITSGIIVETEAYFAPLDRASHAYNNKKTERNKIMFERGGVAYIYLCYGIHHLFNVVTNLEGIPHAVLVRAIEPLEGIANILERKNKNVLTVNLVSGPGSLSEALGITTSLNGTKLNSRTLFIEKYKQIEENEIVSCPRIGVDYAGEHAKLNYRFYIKNNKWVSKPIKIL
ncbi:MAG: DNA-3-methyladenine glycosylase [Bacteroidetes bacterium]|nr:DNA-3-methyladenine glycosylase [Bacteroidota bacterium]